MIEYLKLWSDLYMKKQEKKHTSLKVQRYWVRRQQYTELFDLAGRDAQICLG